MMRLIWKLFRKRLLKYVLEEQNKPKGFKDLEFAFIDNKGRNYFRYPDGMAMSNERFSKLQEFQQFMAARITAENLRKICDTMIQIIEDGLTNNSGASRVAALIYQIRDRQDRIVPHQVLLQIMAVQYVRQDEVPEDYDNSIQMEKVNTFLDDAELSNSFFLNLPEWKKLTSLRSFTQEDWQEYLVGSKVEEEVINQAIQIISSTKLSTKKGKATEA